MTNHLFHQPTTSRRHRSIATLVLALATLTTSACDPGDEPEADGAEAIVPDGPSSPDALDVFEVDPGPDDQQQPPSVRAPTLLARVERGNAAVEWRDTGNPAEVLLMITGTADDALLLDMDTAESLSPIEAWVAIADQPTIVPPLLLERATTAELALLDSPIQIDSLRAEVRHKLDTTQQIQAQPLEPTPTGPVRRARSPSRARHSEQDTRRRPRAATTWASSTRSAITGTATPGIATIPWRPRRGLAFRR